MSRPKPSTAQRGYGSRHRQARIEALRDLQRYDGQPCARCAKPMWHADAAMLDLDHTEGRDGYRGLAHRSCNRRAGQAKATRRATVVAGLDHGQYYFGQLQYPQCLKTHFEPSPSHGEGFVVSMVSTVDGEPWWPGRQGARAGHTVRPRPSSTPSAPHAGYAGMRVRTRQTTSHHARCSCVWASTPTASTT